MWVCVAGGVGVRPSGWVGQLAVQLRLGRELLCGAQFPTNDSFFLMMGSVGTEWICKEGRIISRGPVVPQPLVTLITTLSRVVTSMTLCRFALSSSP